MTAATAILLLAAVAGAPVVDVTGTASGVETDKTEVKAAKSKRPARITSRSTYYDRKEGIAIFTGAVPIVSAR
jgi:lipopolysaccharide export system protein LptA